jgi:hypothetical protein
LSNPYFASNAAVTAALGAFSLKKGPPGTSCITKKVMVIIKNMVITAKVSLLTMYKANFESIITSSITLYSRI